MQSEPADCRHDKELIFYALRHWDKEMRAADPLPNWSKWQAIPVVRLYEAVSLSLSIEPIPLADTTMSFWESILPALDEKAKSAASIAKRFGNSNPELVSLLMRRERQNFEDRLLIAERNVGIDKHLPCIEKSEVRVLSMVRLADFVSWALQKKLDIAPELTGLAESAHVDDWPWGDYSTDMLRKLDVTVRKFWANYDPDDQTIAPTNAQVIDWLVKKYNMTKGSAEPIARIARADGLKSGPRTVRDC